MALFRASKFDDLENEFFSGKQFNVETHNFTLTLMKIIPNPTRILDYDWKVTLTDGYEFSVNMGAQNLGYPSTRLAVITEKLKESGKYQDDYLANAINDEIDQIFRRFR